MPYAMEVHMKKSTMTMAAVSFALSLATIALAATHPSQGTPGWKYGGYNCGCLTNQSPNIVSCKNCCNQAGSEGLLDPDELSNCHAFCNQAVFPCQTHGTPIEP